MIRQRCAVLAAGLATLCICWGCEKSLPAATATQAATPAVPSHVDSRAIDAMRRMSALISSSRAFSLKSTVTMDELLPSGQLAAFTRESTIVVRRPDRLFVGIRRGEDNWLLWFAGSELTVLDKSAKTWAAVRVPGKIDAMLTEVEEKYGLTMPLSDLLFTDPYKTLMANVLAGRYVGEHSVRGVKCQHFLFTQENVDWQIWIDAQNKPLPVRVLIDYKNRPGRPQFEATLSNWNLSVSPDDDQFKPTLPPDAAKVEFIQLLNDAQGPPVVSSEVKVEVPGSLPAADDGQRHIGKGKSSQAPGSGSR